MSGFNDSIVEEFRANGGEVARFAGSTLVLLHTVGARSGQERVTPLVSFPRDGGWVVVASAAGAPRHPAWFHNLTANPDASIEVGARTLAVHAEVLAPAERDALWSEIAAGSPGFDGYQERAGDRTIPLVRLSPR